MSKLVVAALAALVLVPSALAKTPIVPSLTPTGTHALWRAEVARAKQHRVLNEVSCTRPARAIFYAQTDWLRLATKLAAQASPCVQYYVSVPPLSADKAQARSSQASQIRALGANFHALDEVSWNGWSAWVTANNATWFDAGVTARQRMAAAGFDAAAGDTWALNELSSAVRTGTGAARANALEFMRGLSSDGVKGVLFVAGVGQTTSDTSQYKVNLQNWLQDSAFWSAVPRYASDWAQENYGDVRAYAVAGASPDARRDAETQYLGHELALANAGPDSVASARAFLQASYVSFGNAAWAWNTAYGFTSAPVATMQDFVSGQVYAARSIGDRLGFAWAPNNTQGLSDTDFNAQSGSVLDRLAAAIRDSVASPSQACAPSWCTTAVDGAAFTAAWQSFSAWSPTVPVFTTAPVTAQQGGAGAGPVTVELRTSGLADGGVAHSVSFSSTSAGGAFASTSGGPWAPTLTVTVPAGTTTVSVWYEDTIPGSPTIVAAVAGGASATQAETVAAAVVAPAPTGGGGGGSTPLPTPTPTPAPQPAPQPTPQPAPQPAPSRAPAPRIAKVRTRVVAGHVTVSVTVSTQAAGVRVAIRLRRGTRVVATFTRVTSPAGVASWRSSKRMPSGRYTATAAVRSASTA